MVPTESGCADAMQTIQEVREEAAQLGRNEVPRGATKATCNTGFGVPRRWRNELSVDVAQKNGSLHE